jgi:hypothetical protein
MVKIARVKEIKIHGKRTILVKNFGGFSPKSVVFLCAFSTRRYANASTLRVPLCGMREIIFLTNLEQ